MSHATAAEFHRQQPQLHEIFDTTSHRTTRRDFCQSGSHDRDQVNKLRLTERMGSDNKK